MGAPRGYAFVRAPKIMSKVTFPVKMSPIYRRQFLPVFKKKRKFDSGARNINPMMCEDFTNRQKIYFLSLLNSSTPRKDDMQAIELGFFENKICTILEWILSNVFMTLPYAQVAHVTAEKMENISKTVGKTKGMALPFGRLS